MINLRRKLFYNFLTAVYVIEVQIDSGAIPSWKFECVAIQLTNKTWLNPCRLVQDPMTFTQWSPPYSLTPYSIKNLYFEVMNGYSF